jgi:hypothetical protein
MSERNDFDQWEQEARGDADVRDITLLRSSLHLAQELQLGMLQLDVRDRAQLGVEALQLLTEQQQDVFGKKFYLHVMGAIAIFQPPRFHAHALQYGEMIVSGAVGPYGLSVQGDRHTLTMQVYEPKQQKVWDRTDVMNGRLPVPLTVPVVAVESIFAKG